MASSGSHSWKWQCGDLNPGLSDSTTMCLCHTEKKKLDLCSKGSRTRNKDSLLGRKRPLWPLELVMTTGWPGEGFLLPWEQGQRLGDSDRLAGGIETTYFS